MIRKIVQFVFLFSVLVLTFSCEARAEDSGDQQRENPYFCFYLDKDETILEAREYLPEQEDTEFMLKDLMQLLGSKAPDGKLTELLPEGVTVNSYELQDDLLAIDFDSQYSKMSRIREILVRAGIVKTFLQVPGIRAVRFTVEGEELTDSKNQLIGELTQDSFLEYSGDSDVSEYRFETLTLYFTDETGEILVPEQRNVYYKQTLQKERVVVEQLARGPMQSGHFQTIPGNVTVDKVSVSDGICYITVDESFLDHAPGDLPEEIVLYSIVNSIVDSCGESRVQLSAGGNTNKTLGEHLELYHFYEYREDLISEEKPES